MAKTIDQAFSVRHFAETAISPDGRRLAWVELLREANGAESRNSVIPVYLSARPGLHAITGLGCPGTSRGGV